MPNTNISAAQTGNMASYVQEIQVANVDTDGVSSSDETEWQNTKWSNWLGYYKKLPIIKIAIDMRSIWTLGQSYEADSYTKTVLDNIKGYGRDSFNTILKNMMITRRIGGDAFAEIIRDEEGNLLNLKPLDPGQIKIVVDKKGTIKHYIQVSKTKNGVEQKFKKEEIFHLINNRVADEIHGVSDISVVEDIILAHNEAFQINKQIMRNFARPKMLVEVDSDDTAKIAAYAVKFDQATATGDNIFYPKGTVKAEVLAVPSGASINLIPWMEALKTSFWQVVGIPQIIVGSSGEFTESTAKIAFAAFEQSVRDEQQDLEDAIWNQLYLKINLKMSVSLQNELLTDEKKDGENKQMAATLNPAGMEE